MKLRMLHTLEEQNRLWDIYVLCEDTGDILLRDLAGDFEALLNHKPFWKGTFPFGCVHVEAHQVHDPRTSRDPFLLRAKVLHRLNWSPHQIRVPGLDSVGPA